MPMKHLFLAAAQVSICSLFSSGYLISSLLRDEFAASGKIDFLRFYIRRAARLMPLLWCMLLAFLPFILFGHHRADLIKPWLATAAYTMNWNRAFAWWPDYAFGHTLSLAAEEQFYILWPGLFLLVRARKPLLWLSATIAIITFWRFHLVAMGAARLYAPTTALIRTPILSCWVALWPWCGYTDRVSVFIE